MKNLNFLRVVRLKCIVASLILIISAPIGRAGTFETLGRGWLDEHKDPPLVNVSGNWDSEFGNIHLNQQDESREVKGMGGGYEIRGVVSGKSVFLLFLTGENSVDYCAVLTQEKDNGFYGSYYNRVSRFNHHDLCQNKSRPMSLRKQ